MDINSMVIVSGLVAFLVAFAAVRDSEDGWKGAVGPMSWSFSGSWASSIAVVLVVAFPVLGLGSSATLVGLGILILLTPLIYRGMGGSDGASKPVFFIVSTLMTWATLAILYVAATTVPELIGSLPLLSVLIIDAALVMALIGAVVNAARSLAEAASGDGSGAWTLP